MSRPCVTTTSGTGLISRVTAKAHPHLRVLFLSVSYPNNVLPLLGLWVQGLVRHCAPFCESKVISPVPYCPPLLGLAKEYSRFRRIERRRWEGGVEVFHPRFLVPPGHRLHGIEDVPYYFAAGRIASRLRSSFPFDVIHAHFSYPDGCVAARLGRRFGVPIIITEHAPWRPWMDNYPSVLRKAKRAFNECAFHIGVSRSVQDETSCFVGDSDKLRVIPCGVDGSIFTLRTSPRPQQILFAGAIRHIKGVDILLRAMRLLMDRGRQDKLVVVGDSFFKNYQADYARVRQMATDLGLRVDFVGGKTQRELARYMQESAVLVLPSRKESLGMVLVEALACGTPVVATRCGGPEGIVNDQVGVLVPPEDPEALARAIARVIDSQDQYKPAALRAYALEKFSWQGITEQYIDLYREAVARHTLK